MHVGWTRFADARRGGGFLHDQEAYVDFGQVLEGGITQQQCHCCGFTSWPGKQGLLYE
jgi:hypothetical protein